MQLMKVVFHMDEEFNSAENKEEIRVDMEEEQGYYEISIELTNNFKCQQSQDDHEAEDIEIKNKYYHQQVPFLGLGYKGFISESSPNYMVTNNRSWFIFKVPMHFREADEMAYAPKIVSIGPLHRKKKSLLSMEDEKKRFLYCLLNEINQENSCTLDSLKRALREMETEVRSCYSMTFHDMSSDDFVEMMLIDGCFIIRLLCLNHSWHKEKEVPDPIFTTRWMLPNIGRDLLMIQNQLPLFVLEKLFNLTLLTQETSFKKLALEFFRPLGLGRKEMVIKKYHKEGHSKHLLDSYHSFYIPPNSSHSAAVQEEMRNKRSLRAFLNVQGKNWILDATTLKSSGVKFHAKAGDPLDIEFKNRTLKIPRFSIDENSTLILKNLLVYEQSSRSVEPYFTTLVLFLSSIAAVPEDIKILREAKIIQHQPSDDRMLFALLKLLSKRLECDINDCSIIKQLEDVKAYSRSKFMKFRNFMGRSVRQNAVSFFVLYVSLVITFSFHPFGIQAGMAASDNNS